LLDRRVKPFESLFVGTPGEGIIVGEELVDFLYIDYTVNRPPEKIAESCIEIV